ncbi:MAG: DUF86 domain-containing protein [Candidatus Pacebacteria bacterium]|nr:DUF86 domain-containing protein [Candidatus Paceibacterota bacterium]NUQ56917.1 DUF86 domain-containing protein [Candidatus Paceibacter sp.]
MEENRDNVYLQHILEAIESINEYLRGLDYESLLKDKKTIDAVVRELEIIGEAANNLSDDFKKKHPEIPFRDMSDMRNVLIHEYFGVNTKIVWDTCQDDLPKLKEVIKAIIVA